MQKSRLPQRFYTVLVAGALILLGIPFVLRTADWHTVYIPAAQRLMAGGNLYDPHAGFTYPPAMAWLTIPFSSMPKRLASAAWYLVNALSLVAVWWYAWLVAAAGRRRTWDWREHVVLWVGVLLSLRFVTDALDHQQTDLLVAALSLSGCAALLRRSPGVAATLFGLGAAIKVTPLLWSYYFLVRRLWLPSAVVILVAIVLNLAPELGTRRAGGGLWIVEWAKTWVQPMVDPQYPPGLWATAPLYNQSLAGTLYRLNNYQVSWQEDHLESVPRPHPPNLTIQRAVAVSTAAVLVLLSSVVIAWPLSARSGERLAGECATVLLLMVLLSPASSKPHFVTVILAALVLARRAVYGRSPAAALCLLVSFAFAVSSNRMLVGRRVGLTMLWMGGVTWCALVLLLGCLLSLWSRSPGPEGYTSDERGTADW